MIVKNHGYRITDVPGFEYIEIGRDSLAHVRVTTKATGAEYPIGWTPDKLEAAAGALLEAVRLAGVMIAADDAQNAPEPGA